MQLDIINYFEPLVVERIKKVLDQQQRSEDTDFFMDVACIALNKLPARYVRHAVDATFYMSSEEFANTTLAINDAVTHAIEYVDQRRDIHPDGSAHQS
jgi:hypothetical protein